MLDAVLVCADELTVPFDALLVYDSADPYAVHIEFPAPGGKAATTCAFARSPLDEGRRVACGEGDIRVFPLRIGVHGHGTAQRLRTRADPAEHGSAVPIHGGELWERPGGRRASSPTWTSS
ncbi:SsgA family sporulation/cell division regulator [Streptomyces sp. NPDC086010]|uniref:SsgA family sporulation/cell division regulator n=1 Tax=Streptomyces sp. NPDC086010 TaxID=3365745 RepID=UPI0037D5CF4D